MLKTPEPEAEQPPERPVGEIVHQLVEEGKAYAQAEIGVVKAIATAKGKALALPAGLIFAAMLVAQAAVTVLAAAIFVSLSWVMTTVLAGLLTFVLFAAISAGLAWYALQRFKQVL